VGQHSGQTQPSQDDQRSKNLLHIKKGYGPFSGAVNRSREPGTFSLPRGPISQKPAIFGGAD
jgi:hypothetical protein